jgi:hypothetical protein
LAKRNGLSEIVLAVRRQKAWPSASAFLHAVAPIDVLPPGLLSTMKA